MEVREAKVEIAALRRKFSEAEAQSAQSRENEARAVKELAEARAELARRETVLAAVARERDAERTGRLAERGRFNELLAKARRIQEDRQRTRGALQRAIAENQALASQLAVAQRQTTTAHRNGAAVGAVATGLVGLFALLAREGASEDDEDLDDED